MAYRTLLMHLAERESVGAQMRMAASVAKLCAADLIGVGARAPWPNIDAEEPLGELDVLVEQTIAELDEIKGLFASHADLFARRPQWRSAVLLPDIMIGRQACAADLVIAARPGHGALPGVTADVGALVLELGLPVLLLPEQEAPLQLDTVVVCWKRTRESRRAISAGLPLLRLAGRVVVAGVCAADDEAEVRGELADVGARLAAHGVKAEQKVIDGPDHAGQRLLSLAADEAAGLVIAGAYGHSRLREWVLGGVTRALLSAPGPYVLLSH